MCRWKELCKRLDNSYLQGTAEQFFQEPLQSDTRSKLNTADELIRLLMMRSQFPTNDLIGKSKLHQFTVQGTDLLCEHCDCWLNPLLRTALLCSPVQKSKSFQKEEGGKKKKNKSQLRAPPRHINIVACFDNPLLRVTIASINHFGVKQ